MRSDAWNMYFDEASRPIGVRVCTFHHDGGRASGCRPSPMTAVETHVAVSQVVQHGLHRVLHARPQFFHKSFEVL